jgi:hypothetical protein
LFRASRRKVGTGFRQKRCSSNKTGFEIEAPVGSIINGPALRRAEIPLPGHIGPASDTAFIPDTAHFSKQHGWAPLGHGRALDGLAQMNAVAFSPKESQKFAAIRPHAAECPGTSGTQCRRNALRGYSCSGVHLSTERES